MSDYIDRQAAIAHAISGRIRTLPTSEEGENWIRTEEVRQSLLDIPPAEVEPVKRGKWIEHYLLEKWRNAPWGYKCSECGAWFVVGQEPIKRYHYCPNCGAKMDAPTIIEAEEGEEA